MICFPNGKINFGLNVVNKRDDGYHDLESIFYPIACHDAIEIVPAERMKMHFYGDDIPGDSSQNSCLKVYKLMRERYEIKPIEIHLFKKIPIQAGLGGGSADASFFINLLDETFSLNLDLEEKVSLALEIGSDCPFFIRNQAAFCTGRGEEMEMVDLSLSAYDLYLVSPSVSISTPWAYGQISPQRPEKSVIEIAMQAPETWKAELENDFEAVVFDAQPQLAELKTTLYKQGAVYASMSGSGSAFYGLFKKGSIDEAKMRSAFENKVERQWLIPLN